MLHLAILTAVLVSGECPECERGGWGVLRSPAVASLDGYPRARALVPPPPVIKHPSIIHVIPCPVVRCVGQNCFSVTRPYLPGVPVFDYRKDFNYPWSQEPCALAPPVAAYGEPYFDPSDVPPADGPEFIPAPQLESSRRKAQPSSRITKVRSGGPQLTSRVIPAAAKRR
ncbi:MAG: hypothetical protein AB7O59_02070 [Pirellulales bacterium]